MIRELPILGFLLVVLALPFALRPKVDLLAKADDSLVIVTPHNEAIRHEFATAFSRVYKEQTGRSVRIDWRTPGGTSEIAKFIESEFIAAFRTLWTSTPGRGWSDEIEKGFANHRIELGADPSQDSLVQSARRMFLESNVGIRIDLFFGGGSYDFVQQARAGRLVDSGMIQAHPEWFSNDAIPQALGGETYYDSKGLWIGTCLSAFGVCSNLDSLQRLGVTKTPDQWADLAQPEFFAQVAMADPTKSGSIAKAFEMLIQQQMLLREAAGSSNPAADGWVEGLRLLQRISGNARYFTDAASKIVVDVALGDAAAGMCIDFYGRQQSEAVAEPDGRSRMVYVSPIGGTSVGVDPIGMLRGAPNREVATRFIEFVLSPEGQRLWNYKPGTPGGPERFALRRLPIQPSLYSEETKRYRSDPNVYPFDEARLFNYRSEWTGSLFGVIRFVVRVMCLEPHEELRTAWQALSAAGFPPKAMATFHDVSILSYDNANEHIRRVLSSRDPLEEVALARDLTAHFRSQYLRAAALAISGE